MARSRLELQALLSSISGVKRAYFSPPNGLIMEYPCIVYEWEANQTQYADNLPYAIDRRYTVTVIDRTPDSSISDKVSGLPKSSFSRYFAADDLNHFVYTLYF